MAKPHDEINDFLVAERMKELPNINWSPNKSIQKT
jgi:hypothetical protein